MKLAPFIKEHHEEIIDEWVNYAEENIEGANKMELEEVRDHIKQMLIMIANNMEKSETGTQQKSKSKGNKENKAGEGNAAKEHGGQRARIGFDIVDLSSEFRALRASVLRLWEDNSDKKKSEEDFDDMIRFNEAIDELWMDSLQRFHFKVDESKNWFLGILGHDLRNPLAAIKGVQTILKLSKNLSDRERELLERSDSSVKRMAELISNLLELTNLRLGNGLTINKITIDLSKQTEKIVQEMELGYPDASLFIKSPGPVQGEWDEGRLDQLMTNLITNGLRHGTPGGPVKISISAEGNNAFLEVHNEGSPMPQSIKDMISTGKFSKNEGNSKHNDSYGLGLYIVKEIVDGHNGEIKVTSSKEKGTTFKVTLPRY